MMRYRPISLRRLQAGGAVCVGLLLTMQGCGSKEAEQASSPAGGANAQSASNSANAPDAELRKSFSQKGFDINTVPPAQREQVRAMMQQNAKPASTGK